MSSFFLLSFNVSFSAGLLSVFPSKRVFDGRSSDDPEKNVQVMLAAKGRRKADHGTRRSGLGQVQVQQLGIDEKATEPSIIFFKKKIIKMNFLVSEEMKLSLPK